MVRCYHIIFGWALLIYLIMEINKEELFKLYMDWVNHVVDECDWKTHFEPEEIVYAIAGILENNPELISTIKTENGD